MGGERAGKSEEFRLVGAANFKRHNPKSDRFPVHRFHHIEFWCSDATNTYKRFQYGLGMTLVAKSDQSTGNSTFASYVLQSNDLTFVFTAPYSRHVATNSAPGGVPFPWCDQATMYDFIAKHGLAVRAVGLAVDDAAVAYTTSVEHGAVPVLAPQLLTPLPSAAAGSRAQCISEVLLYGECVMRYVSGAQQGAYLAGFTPVTDSPAISYGLQRLDHAVGNVHKLAEAAQYIMRFTGFHEFAEFVAEDVGTLDSGLNSCVLANNSEYVLLPINEPTFGTPRKSQIQTYLEQNEGPGLQHLALKTDDIFATLREMRARSSTGGFEFMPQPSAKYYKELPTKVGDALTSEQLVECEALGILVDKDDQGVLLQIFTKPLGDRPTVFIEIIQRLGCAAPATPAPTEAPPPMQLDVDAVAASAVASSRVQVVPVLNGGPPGEDQPAGCGGFGKGNFGELFKRIEDYERTLTV